MYCPVSNVLFIHIPKNAGQTIAAYFLRLEALTWEQRELCFMGGNSNPALGPPQVSHFTLDEYLKSGFISDLVLNSAIKFAVVRNPWARLWSEYNYYWKSVCSWDDFFDLFPGKIIDCHLTGRDALRHIKPQVDFMAEGVEVLSFENLDADFSNFCIRHGLPNTGLNKKMNVLNSGHYVDAYDEKKIAIVREFYWQDIEAFGYEFGD